jgi:WD40 repeat protein
MSFDKYLFEKYTKDCVVEISFSDSLEKGTGFWVLPDGHILTCYHVLITTRIEGKSILSRKVEIENNEAQIKYHGHVYIAELDRERSKKELDIAVLKVKEISEKIHFVPLGDPELNTEVQVFGYRVDGKSETFKNGYHISGTLRFGQVLNDGGLVYNLETNQPPNSTVKGMSGSPVYDLNTSKVIGIQASEEKRGPSICYVHPTAKVYKLWPELRSKNFHAIRKDFNTYFMTNSLPKGVFTLSIALLQETLENKVGKRAIGVAEQTIFNIGGERVTGKLNKILGTCIGAKQLWDFIWAANERFHSACINGDLCDAFTLPESDLLSIQAALNDLPKAVSQNGSRKAISEALGRDYPELSQTQIKEGLDLYSDCLKQEMQPLKDFVLSTIKQGEKQIYLHTTESDSSFSDVLVSLEKYIAQRGAYMVLEDIRTGLGGFQIEEWNKEAQAQTSMLEEILNRKPQISGELDNWQPAERFVNFLRQVYNRINNDDEKEKKLKPFIEKLLTDQHLPWLVKYYSRTKAPCGISPAFQGHALAILKLAFTPNGENIISASSDCTLRLWDVESGQSLRTFYGHTSEVLCFAVALNGKHVFSGSSDRTIRKWDIDSGTLSRAARREKNYLWDMAVVPKTHLAIIALSDKHLCLRDLESEQTPLILEGHKEPCSNIAISSDGKFFISASDDTTLHLWETSTGRLLNIFEGHSDKVFSVAIIPNRKQAVSASGDHTLRIWDLVTGRSLHTLKGHTGAVHCVIVTPDGKYAISASADRNLRLWDITTQKCLSLFTSDEPFQCCAISPNGSIIAAGDQSGKIHLIRLYPS